MKPMNIAVVGCGGFAAGNHIPNARQNPHVHIRALCDLDERVLAKLDETYGPDYVCSDCRRIAADEGIEAVVLATPPSVRVGPIKALAEAGKHIYVEKPMSLGRKDSQEIAEIIARTGVKLQVGFNRPYARIMQEAKRIFRKIARKPTLISYRIVGENILWPQFHQDDVAAGRSNTIVHEATHIFDLLNWLTDRFPERIYAVGGASDNHIVTLAYPDETYATILSGSCGSEADHKERMEVFTDNKVLVMNGFVELECTRVPGESDQSFPLKSHPWRSLDERVTPPEIRKDLIAWRDALTDEDIAYGYYYHNRPNVEKGHADALEAFYQAIRNDTPIERDAVAGAAATITGIEAIRSLETGHPVDLDFSAVTAG